MPLKPDEPQSEQVNARITPSVLRKIDQYAREEHRSRSLMILVMLSESIDLREGGKR